MPSKIHLSIDVLDTKAWATATIDSLFSETTPISFEPYAPRIMSAPSTPDTLRKPSRTPVRRSFSLLEYNFFNHAARCSTNDKSRAARPLTASFTSSPNLLEEDCVGTDSSYSIDSDPGSSPAPSARTPISVKLKRNWSFDRSSVKHLSHAFSRRSLSFKEREGIIIWKKTFQSLQRNEPPPITKSVVSSRSEHLARFITTELVSTEQTYLDHLMIVKQMFMDPLLEAATDQAQSFVNLRDIQTIFSFIPQLILLSSSVLQRLRCTPEGVGKAFCEVEDDFKVYISYAANFRRLQKSLTRANRSIVYRELVQASLRKKETNRMGLSDYMIAPIQRITRYGLLLKDLRKHFPLDHPGYSYLDRALKSLSALAVAMNGIQ